MDKLTQLSLFLDRQLGKTDSPLQKFIIARDQAYFRTAFFSGDRPGDLGQVKVPEILRFPMMMGFCLIISGEISARWRSQRVWNQPGPASDYLSH